MKINYCINYENFIKGDYYNDILKKTNTFYSPEYYKLSYKLSYILN